MTGQGPSYVQVVLPLKLDWVPWYRLAEGNVSPGDKVRVSFAGREYTGVTVRVSGQLPPELDGKRVMDVISTEPQLAPITAEEISFWSMVGGYYMCSIGEVFKTACPAVRLSREEVCIRARQREEERQRKALEALARKEERRLSGIARLEARISKAEASMSRARNEESRRKYELLADTLREGLARLRADGNGPAPEADGPVRAGSADTASSIGVTLSEEQEKAAERIRKTFAAGKTALLHGVTGSGKTEIYCKLALEVMEKGLNVLYLVPEIAMSRQLETRLGKYFGDSLMVFHSHETEARRWAVADRLASPDKNVIVLGTRSALFLPHRRLGLVIVDEEHESSYKQESPAPRYNGRDAALMLAAVHKGCNAVLGSATPSLESLYNCKTGKYGYVRLEKKYHGAGEAEVEIIDTIAERKKNGMSGAYSIKLIERIEKALASGGQVLILRSRRSYSPVVQCSECGDIPKCPRCNISLSLHKYGNGPQLSGDAPAGAGRLVCHHCGYSLPSNGFCRSCGGALTGIGAGTQKLEEEARRLFPGARIERLDSDTARNPHFEEEAVRKFAAGETDILIGTQIVAKGFDFGGLSLVVVMAADSLLAVEDFRADEKAIQLLEQVRGRCGRRDSKGLVVIQTARPQHPVFSAPGGGNRITGLMEERAAFGYPPYTRIVSLVISDRFEDRCNADARRLADVLGARFSEALVSGRMSLVGPYAPGQGQEAGMYRREIRASLRRDGSIRSVKEGMLSVIREFEKESRGRVKVAIDVDPL